MRAVGLNAYLLLLLRENSWDAKYFAYLFLPSFVNFTKHGKGGGDCLILYRMWNVPKIGKKSTLLLTDENYTKEIKCIIKCTYKPPDSANITLKSAH